MIKKLWKYYKNSKFILLIGGIFIAVFLFFSYDYVGFIAMGIGEQGNLFLNFGQDSNNFVKSAGLPLPFGFETDGISESLYIFDGRYYLSLFVIDLIFWTAILTIIFYIFSKNKRTIKKLWKYFKNNSFRLLRGGLFITIVTFVYDYLKFIVMKADTIDWLSFNKSSGLPFSFIIDGKFYLSLFITDIIIWTTALTIIFYKYSHYYYGFRQKS